MLDTVALLPAHDRVEVALQAGPALVVLDVEAKVVLRVLIARDRSGGVLQRQVATAGDHSGANLRDGHHCVISRGAAIDCIAVIITHDDSHRVLGAAAAPHSPREGAVHGPGFRVGTVDQNYWSGAELRVVTVAVHKGHGRVPNVTWVRIDGWIG